MFEVGHKRPDNKYNVWRDVHSDYHRTWVIVEVFDNLPDALKFAAEKNRRRNRPSYKANQNGTKS